jgi:hypothetical protein
MSGVSNGEYFIGSDPGAGLGTPMDWDGTNLSAALGASLPVGEHLVSIRAKDNAGNWSGLTHTTLTILDTTAPVITYELTPMPGLGGWNNSPVVLTWQVSDPESSVTEQTGCDTATVNADTAGTLFTCSATSAGGTSSQSVTVKYDTSSPTLLAHTWSQDPVAVTTNTTLSVPVIDTLSGVTNGEFFIGADPGVGNGDAMVWNPVSSTLTATFGDNLPVGSYTVGFRARDLVGNWSMTDLVQLVVWDPAAPTSVTGQNSVRPVFGPGQDEMPGLIEAGQNDKLDFGFNLNNLPNGQIDSANSAFDFNYQTGKKCNNPDPAKWENCHLTTFTATSFTWLIVNGTNNSKATFQGTGTLVVDGISTSNPFKAEADDSLLFGSGADNLTIYIYDPGANPNTDDPIYKVVDRDTLGQGIVFP